MERKTARFLVFEHFLQAMDYSAGLKQAIQLRDRNQLVRLIKYRELAHCPIDGNHAIRRISHHFQLNTFKLYLNGIALGYGGRNR